MDHDADGAPKVAAAVDDALNAMSMSAMSLALSSVSLELNSAPTVMISDNGQNLPAVSSYPLAMIPVVVYKRATNRAQQSKRRSFLSSFDETVVGFQKQVVVETLSARKILHAIPHPTTDSVYAVVTTSEIVFQAEPAPALASKTRKKVTPVVNTTPRMQTKS